MTRILSVFNFLKRVGFAVLFLGTTASHAQWYTDPIDPARTCAESYLGALIADSSGGAYFFSAFGLPYAHVMHVQIDGAWDLPYPGVFLGGRGTISSTGSLVDSENNFVIDNQHFWGDQGGPHLPNHLVKVGQLGEILWDYAFPDTNTRIRTMVKGLQGSILIDVSARVPDPDSSWLYHYPQFLQIFDVDGNSVFGWDEVPLSSEVSTRIFLSDGMGGAIYAWIPLADSLSNELRMQHINHTGAFLFPEEGLHVPANHVTKYSSLIDASPDGFLLQFYDSTLGQAGYSRVNFEGELEWTTMRPAGYPSRAVPDGIGGVFLNGPDFRVLTRLMSDGEYAFEPESLEVGFGYSTVVSRSSGLNLLGRRPDSAFVLQRYDTLGHAQWENPLVVFNFPPHRSVWYWAMTCDVAGGTILCFYRVDDGWYFTRVDVAGNIGSSVFIPERPWMPETYEVRAYPNPFNSSLVIGWSVGARQHADVRIYNVIGQEVHQWSIRNPDKTSLLWDGRDSGGMALPSGKYFVQITSDAHAFTIPVILLK